MKKETFQKRTKQYARNAMCWQYANELLTTGKSIRTCHTSGRGRFLKNLDYTGDTEQVLKCAGLKYGVDFITKNDAPRGGACGQYIELTSKGRRKMIKS